MAEDPRLLKLEEISQGDFQRLSQFIYDTWGIHLADNKKILVEGRLRKRILALGLKSFREYCDYLFSPEGLKTEPSQMIDLITTNKTEFLREADHFDFLTNRVLPGMISKGCLKINVWSAGCSSGEEPYTLAMILSEFVENQKKQRLPVPVVGLEATDISAKVLNIAKQGIYREEAIEKIPMEWRKKYLLRSKDPQKRVVRFTPEIRGMIKFERVNLMEIPETFKKNRFNIIFCRNVIIYFDRPTQERLLNEYYRFLERGGHLFLGHSEALTNLKLPFKSIAPTVYVKE